MKPHVLLALLPLLASASQLARPAVAKSCDSSYVQRQSPLVQSGRNAAEPFVWRLRGGESLSLWGSLAPLLRVLRRFVFPGNPARERAPPPPPAPPPAPPAAAASAGGSGGLNRGGSSKGKGRRGASSSSNVGSVHSVHSKAEFDKLVNSARSKQLVVVDFAASWCGPCQQIAPKFEAMASALPHVRFLKVDVDECKDLQQQYGVKSMPTFKMLKGGKEVDEMKGADEGALREKIESLAGQADRWASAGSGKTI